MTIDSRKNDECEQMMFLKEDVTLSGFSPVEIHSMAAIDTITLCNDMRAVQLLSVTNTPTTSIRTDRRHFNMLLSNWRTI